MKNCELACLLLLASACAERSAGPEPSATTTAPRAAAAPSTSEVAATPPDVRPTASEARPTASEVTSNAGAAPASTPDPVPEGLIVHEWGTFTSVGSSTGALLEGLHHEEEALPAFVHGRSSGTDALIASGKAMETQPASVTQKLETPVLYFYGAAAQGVRVRVEFPSGVVSQWFPSAARFGPALGAVTVPKDGFMEWVIDLRPGMSPVEFPAVGADDIWAPSRRVAAVPVAVGSERERFIFYRGLGTFELPLVMTVDEADRITIDNRSSDACPAVFLLRVHPGGGAIVELGALPGGGVISGVPSPVGGKEHDLDVYVADAQDRIAAALVRTGLYPDEARAMVDTWSKSYFKSEGLRILYVVPRAWTDKLLPLSVQPAPSALVRTLVGRVELLAPSEENALLTRVSDATTRALAPADVLPSMGRLAEPKLRRALQLARDPAVRDWTQRAITSAAATP
jgi:hypothetical protein